MNVKETDDIFRLYRREWVIVHTTTEQGSEDATGVTTTAFAWARDNLEGRVYGKDMRLTSFTDLAGTFWCHIEVFKDNLKGEFKYTENAQQFANVNQYEEYVIVPRNSKSDHDIRNYGIVKL